MDLIKAIEDGDFKLWLHDGIVHFEYQCKVVDLNIQKRSISKRMELSQGISRPVLSDCRKVNYWTKEAKGYGLSSSSQELITAIALVIESPIQAISWNLAMKLFKIRFPTKVFTDISQALAWLKKHKI
jgi:hypothetical protein